MREVAVTEGDKVEAQIRLGVSVNGYGVDVLADAVAGASDADVDDIVEAYEKDYELVPELRGAATAASPFATPPGSRRGCAGSSRPAAPAPSRTPSRTSTASPSCRGSRCSG